ncbi:golgi-body localization protein domain-containing protein [Glomus cerebriforme]|uniref:Golgi-body localization protein domain-containing protein n=1 Tax=Glomus cerebriforme TaxID=658196 RepID=A0A397SMC2_9GLOM|nr:golgi-body localization protein domain-containing protein [Glomus cerebriforme]
MHLSAKLKEAWVEIRDYPLPLAHIPSTDGKHLYSFFLEGNLVVGEELRGMESVRRAAVDIVTPRYIKGDDSKYTVIVPRTVSPVKLYSDLHVKINSSRPTVCSWSISMQPAIQHFAKVFESFTKPNPDPSETIGFWDKMRIMMHVRILAEFKGTGDVQFYAKGSRDPYLVTGRGAGFVLCWSKNVEIRLGYSNDQNEVLQVDSEEFTCAIPNLAANGLTESESSTLLTQSSSYTIISQILDGNFLKRVMKLCGGVRYGMGVHFQRLCNNDNGPCPTCDGQRKCRLTDFIPHYEIITRMPEYAIVPEGQVYDSFKGFRSDYVHLSVSVSCPINLDNSDDSDGDERKLKNSIELSPKSLQHILSWAFLFEPAMTIPIRQGALFPSLEPPSPKLGKYLGTVKIKICVGPLFLSHFYRDDVFEDPLRGRTHVVGIKGKIERFKFDMHLRSKEKIIEVEGQEVKARDIILHEAEVDLKNLDLRGIAARYIRDNVFSNFSDENEGDEREFLLGKDEDFIVNHEDEEWIDEADYIELDWMLPDVKPVVRVLPLMSSPQMMYYKRPDENDTYEEKKTDQETHICVMGQGRDTVQVQIDFLTERLNQLNLEIKQQTKILSDIEERITADSKNQILQNMSQSIQRTTATLSHKRNVIKEYLDNLEETLNKSGSKYVDVESDDNEHSHEGVNSNFSSPLWADSHSHFGHRFIIHNAEALWNNSLRNLMYKFSNLVEHHQGLTYYMSTSAVKFIRDLQKKIQQQKEREAYEKSLKKDGDSNSSNGLDNYDFDAHMAAEMLRKLVGEQTTSFVVPNEILAEKTTNDQGKSKNSHHDIPEGYSLRKDFIVQLINPQINLQCDKDPDSNIIMCIERAQLKTFSIVEDWSKGDLINEVVKTRMFFGIDNAQFFTSSKKDFLNDYYSKILTANNYGAKGSENWPVWVPMEALISNTKENASPFQRIVKRTSATTQYDKFNNLRIKGSDIKKDDKNGKDKKDYIEQESDNLGVDNSKKEEFDKRIDSFHINFPNIKISATSDQYCIFFDIVTDLFMYREPAQKRRAERLGAILLAADLDNLEGAAERVSALQEQIHQLDDLRLQYELYSTELDEEGLKDLRAVELELINLQEELCLLMEAITASQEKKHETESNVPLKLIATADEVIWVMQENNRNPFCEWKLSNAHFKWVTKEGNASINTLEIDHVVVTNKLPSPVFKELISPYIIDHRRPVDFSRNKMIRVYWGELEPVAGIAMVDHFEIDMFPLKFQMQYDIGKLIMMYIFPEKRREYIIKQNNIKANENGQVSHNTEQKRNSSGSEQTAKLLKKTSESYSDSLISETTETASDGNLTIFSDDGTISNNSTFTTSTTSSVKKQLLKATGDDYSHELELMKKRASQNRTFIYIKVPGVTHNFSYQGAKEKNLEDIYDFVFRMPTLEYQNKTWSWLDFLEHFKRDILRTILAHTGSLINKKIRGRPTTDNIPSNESKEVAVPFLATALVTATTTVNVTALMNNEGTNSDHDGEGSDKSSILSSESHESQKKVLGIKIKRHEKKDSLTRSIPFTNFHIHKESSGPVLSQSSFITRSIPTSDSSIENENEKGKLLFGKLYNENRSN